MDHTLDGTYGVNNYHNPALPLFVFHVENKWNTRHFPHWHDDVEFIYQSKGHTTFSIGSKLIKLVEGQALIINKGELHNTASTDDYNGEYLSILFDSKILLYGDPIDSFQSKYILPLIKKESRMPTHLTGKAAWEIEVLLHIRKIAETYLQKPEGYELTIKISIFIILQQLISSGSIKKSTGKSIFVNDEKSDRIKLVTEYVQKNFEKRLSMQELADIINMDVCYFSRFFSSLMGWTPIEYVNHYRIKKAASILIHDKNTNIMNIAMDVGFDNLSNFNRKFKKYMGCSPSEYRTLCYIPSSLELPAGWSSKSLSPTPLLCWSYSNDGTFVSSGLGLSLWGEQDEYQLTCKELSGNFAITARVVSVKGIQEWTKVGITVRQGTDNVNKFAHVIFAPCKAVSFDYRHEVGELCNSSAAYGITTPVYLKLARSGDIFTAFYSTGNDNWIQIGDPQHIKMENTVYAGLIVTSNDHQVPSIGVFDNVSLQPIKT